MKRITTSGLSLFFLLMLVCQISHAQNIKNTTPPLTLYTNESGKFVYDTIINVSDAAKTELYRRGKNWVLSTVRTTDNTVVYDDKDSGEIRTNVTLEIPDYPGNYVNFKISLSFKEGKCRIVDESFMYIFGPYEFAYETLPTSKLKIVKKKVSILFDNQFQAFNTSLIKSLFKPSKSDW